MDRIKEKRRKGGIYHERNYLCLSCGKVALAAGSLYGCAPEDGEGTAAPSTGTEAQSGSKAEESTAAAVKAEVNEELSGDLVSAIWDNNLMDWH